LAAFEAAKLMLARTVNGSVGLDGAVDASNIVKVAATGLVI
jgi:hypothetical protein